MAVLQERYDCYQAHSLDGCQGPQLAIIDLDVILPRIRRASKNHIPELGYAGRAIRLGQCLALQQRTVPGRLKRPGRSGRCPQFECPT